MKKYIAIILAFMLIMSLFACSVDKSTQATPTPVSNEPASTPSENVIDPPNSNDDRINQTPDNRDDIPVGDICKICNTVGDICEACGFCIDCDTFERCMDCNLGDDCCECEKTLEIYQFEPIIITGKGSQITDIIDVPVALSIFSFTHTGRRNFIVRQYTTDYTEVRGGLLANEIGDSTGSTTLNAEDGQVVFDVSADGDWTLTISPFQLVETAELSGSGNTISGVFASPDRGVYRFTHDGRRNFIVYIYPFSGRERLIVNEIGVTDITAIVDFGDTYAYWEIKGDGNWKIIKE